ncbi:MAG TPA: ATP-binding protein [Polyangiaceae bacterium]|nr:ATP-binding protein [Polyangiaceae bacterium]
MARRFGIAGKLLTVCLAFGLPIAVMLVLMTKAKLAEIEFAAKEQVGDAFQRPLEEVLSHISRYRRLWVEGAPGDHSLDAAARAEEASVDQAVAQVVAAQRELGDTLQFTDEGLGIRGRREFTAQNLEKKWNALRELHAQGAPAEDAYSDLVRHVRTMITHAGDASNLILDPDLDSYYLMDVTLLVLPQMEDRLQQVALDVEKANRQGSLDPELRRRMTVAAAFLAEADWDRAAASTRTSIAEDPNFHDRIATLGPSLTPHLERSDAATRRVTDALQALSSASSATGFDLPRFRSDVETLHDALFAFHHAALAEEDVLLAKRISDFESSLHVGFALAGASVLVSAILAFFLASNIVRRVRRIGIATDAFAKGDLGARVGSAGSDELGELAASFDAMTDRIGGLNAEVRRRANELQSINENLESLVAHRTTELQTRNDAVRLILDNAHDGLLTIDLQGKISEERSAMVDRWFGPPSKDATFATYVAGGNATLAAEISLGLDEVAADILPIELTLDQLPKSTLADGKHLRLTYEPIRENGVVTRLLVVIADVTGEMEGRRAAVRQEEILRVFHACQRDRSGFLDFFVDARELVKKICSGDRRPAEIHRLVHTLKGNCALFGVLSISGLCHDIETNMAQGGSGLSPTDLERLEAAWADIAKTVSQIMGEDAAGRLEVADEEYAAIVDQIAKGIPRKDILVAIARWKLEPSERQLGRFAERARSIAQRLGKELDVTVESNDVRLCAETWAPFWSVLSHVIRNAVDHGIETRAERVTAGKPEAGNVHLATRVERGHIVVEVADDGRGVDWVRVAAKAREAGLPSISRKNLVDAVCADGLSTRENVTELSGRGVGMAALKEACDTMGGTVEVLSEPARGTTVRCVFPERLMGGKALAQIVSRPVMKTLAPVA